MSRLKPVYRRDLVGQNSVDFESRVDFARLKWERLARLRAQMAAADLGGVFIYDPINIRYATGTRGHVPAGMRFFHRYALVSHDRVLIFGNQTDIPSSDQGLEARPARIWDFFPCGRNVTKAARLWAADLKSAIDELGIAGERIGIDRLDFTGFDALRSLGIALADARVPFERARAIKTADELTLIRQACAVADVCICAVRDATKAGVTENELSAILSGTNIKLGGEYTNSKVLSAGQHKPLVPAGN